MRVSRCDKSIDWTSGEVGTLRHGDSMNCTSRRSGVFLQELHVRYDAQHNEACDMIWSKSKNMWNHLKTYETCEPGETGEKVILIT